MKYFPFSENKLSLLKLLLPLQIKYLLMNNNNNKILLSQIVIYPNHIPSIFHLTREK